MIAIRRTGATLLGVAACLAVLAPPAGAVPEGPPYPSAEWTAREAENYALTLENPARALEPDFFARWQEQSAANLAAFVQRQLVDPEFVEEGNLCASWAEQCVGDPFRYPGTDAFYDRADVVPVEFADRDGARLSGRVWAPRGATGPLPTIVIANGSVQAPETAYWWLAQALVDHGYLVLTYDPRGQGRSDTLAADGSAGSNLNPQAFPDGLVDAIDFVRSRPAAPYPHAASPTGDAFNPLHARVDLDRLGLAGHSLGAVAVTLVQGYRDWPGVLDEQNPVDVVVALDDLALTVESSGVLPVDVGVSTGTPPAEALAALVALQDQVEAVVPRVPAMGQAGDYFLVPTPLLSPPDPEQKKQGFVRWRDAGVPVADLVIRGGTHYEFSQLPTFPARDWEVGTALSRHYATAWFDRWLKAPGEPGHDDADARLLDDAGQRAELSVYLRSARAFPDRTGVLQLCEDVRAGCPEAGAAPGPVSTPVTDRPAAAAPGRAPQGVPVPGALAATGPPAVALAGLLLLSAAGLVRRRRG